jgi:hypothetical protein
MELDEVTVPSTELRHRKVGPDIVVDVNAEANHRPHQQVSVPGGGACFAAA